MDKMLMRVRSLNVTAVYSILKFLNLIKWGYIVLLNFDP